MNSGKIVAGRVDGWTEGEIEGSTRGPRGPKKVINADSAFIILLILWDNKNGQVGQGDQGIESGLLVKWPV